MAATNLFTLSSVVPGSYTSADITVDDQGLITEVSNGYADRELKISRYLDDTYTTFGDSTVAVQSAIDAFLASNSTSLDLEGLNFNVTSQIDWDQDLVPSDFANPKILRNGTFNVPATWTDGTSAGIFKLFSTLGTNRIEKPKFQDIVFKCNFRASAVDLVGSYYQPIFEGCSFFSPYLYGVRTSGDGGVGLWVRNCQGYGGNANTAFASRTNYFIFQEDETDSKIVNTQANYFLTVWRGIGGSILFSGNHFAQGLEDGLDTDLFHTPIIHTNARTTLRLVGNYFDNGHILFEQGLGGAVDSTFQGYFLATGNTFTKQRSNAAGYFIGFQPTSSSIVLQRIICTNNEFRNFAGASSAIMAEPFKVLLAAGGSIAVAGASEQIEIHTNYFWSDVSEQTSRPTVYVSTAASGTSYAVDLTGMTPFKMAPCNAVVASGLRVGSGSGAYVWFDRTDNYTGDIKLSGAVANNSVITMTFDCNSTTPFS